MAIRVAPGTAQTVCDYGDGFAIQVQRPSTLGAAANALRRARADIIAMASVKPDDPNGPVVSQVVLAPDGPLARFARLTLSDELLRTVPQIVQRRLEEAGVETATVLSPEPGGPLDDLDGTPNAVVLRLFPAPAGAAGALPPEWLDIAAEWALGDLNPTDLVDVRVLAIEYEVRVAEAPAIIHQSGVARAWCDVVNGNLDDRLRTASVTFGRAPHVALAAGGPGCDSHALLARFELLQEVARDLAGDIAYACLDIEPTFEGVGMGLPITGWRANGGASPNVVAGQLCDILVPDAYPWQIIGKGHLDRLAPDGYDADDPPLGDPIADGRVEVLIGDPEEWLPIYDARPIVQAEGWSVLKPCLADDPEVAALLEGRPQVHLHDADDLQDEDVSAGTPDLATIRLETLPHARRGLRLTLLELVSWIAHEPHSDDPASVSPVLATFSRWFASGIDDDHRQELKARAAALAGTAAPVVRPAHGGLPHLSSVDSIRAWMTADWLARVQAPAWLRVAGLTEAANRLESLGPITDNLELVRAVDVLGSAITIAGRRIDITSSIAGTDDDADSALVEQISWDAWEEASESAGWVAASEAAGVGVPSELSYATDLRVIECSRDAHARDELETTRKTVGDAAWATALHAIADEAWQAGWQAAIATAAELTSTIDLQTALDRSTRAAFDRLGLEDDQRENILEAAETTARDSLTRAALRGGAWERGEHPWDAARRAARSSPGGHGWGTIQDMARDAVEESTWESAMAAARDSVDDVLHDASDMVARTVAAAVAREASSAAARGVALRAAAVARAHGDTAEKAAAAAMDSLAATVEQLRASAFDLLDRLIVTEPLEAADLSA